MLLRICALLLVMLGSNWTIALKAQDDGPDPDFVIQQDPNTGLWGVMDASGKAVWALEYTGLGPAGNDVALGFKAGDPDAYILGTSGRMKRVPHADYWRAYKEALLKSDIADRQLIARVLDMNPDPMKRLEEMDNMERTYVGMRKVREEAVGMLLQ